MTLREFLKEKLWGILGFSTNNKGKSSSTKRRSKKSLVKKTTKVKKVKKRGRKHRLVGNKTRKEKGIKPKAKGKRSLSTQRKLKRRQKRTVSRKKSVKRKEREIGVVTHYFDRISVGVILLRSRLRKGERIIIKGKDREFEQMVESMQINHKDVNSALAGKEVGIKLKYPVKVKDKVFKVKVKSEKK